MEHSRATNGFWGVCIRRCARPIAALIVTCIASVAGADEQDTPTSPKLAELVDGAASARAALEAYVVAANAGDAEAALLMIDPPIRRLMIPEMTIEKFAIESEVFTRGLFGDPEFDVGGMLFHSAGRMLVRTREVRILNTQVIDDQRIVFTVLIREKGFHSGNDLQNIVQFLSVRRNNKWYLFRPFGLILMALRTPMIFGDLELDRPLVVVQRPSEDKPLRENADVAIECLIPIEEIHAQLVVVSGTPQIEECQRLAEELRRLYNRVVHRAIREDFQSRDALEAALKTPNDLADNLNDRFFDSFLPAIETLGKQLPPEAESKNKEPDKK